MRIQATCQLSARRWAVAAAAVLVLAWPAAADDLSQTLERLYADGGYQSEIPVPEEMPEQAPATEDLASPPDLPAADQPDPPPPSRTGLVELIGYAIGALILAFAIYILIGSLTGLRLRRGDQHAEARDGTEGAAEPEDAGGGLLEADQLARDGRHSEAIHMLLLAVVAALRNNKSERLGVSVTVREIVKRTSLAGDAIAALRTLALTAELTHFGGRTASSGRFEECRENARTVLAALHGAQA